MAQSILNLFFLICRYVHVVATTLIVGGTLFFEVVVPAAIGELKTEVQLALFARMRLFFRWIVYSSAIALVATGTVSISRNYSVLDGRFIRVLGQSAGVEKIQTLENQSFLNWPKFWFVAHLAAGTLSLLMALLLVSGNKPPERPLQWMKLNLFVLLIAIFMGSASRGARQNLFQAVLQGQSVRDVHE